MMHVMAVQKPRPGIVRFNKDIRSLPGVNGYCVPCFYRSGGYWISVHGNDFEIMAVKMHGVKRRCPCVYKSNKDSFALFYVDRGCIGENSAVYGEGVVLVVHHLVRERAMAM